MDTIMNLDWEALADPALVGIIVSILMGLFGKKVIYLAFQHLWSKNRPGEEMPETLPIRSLTVNFATLVTSFVIVLARAYPVADFGPVFVNTVVATVFSISTHETTKNILATIGVVLS